MQDYNNEPNDQHQLPREHDGERANRCDADSREKPAKQPNQSGSTQEIESDECQKQNDEHFYSPLLNTVVNIFSFYCFYLLNVCSYCFLLNTFTSFVTTF